MRLSVALLLALAAAVPSPEIRYFHYLRPLVLSAGASGQACLALDPATLTHAAPGLADLRLYNGAAETPYVLNDARSVEVAQVSIELLNVGLRSASTVFDAVLPDGPYSDLALDVTGRDFLATVAVYGSQEREPGRTRIGSFTIFDFSTQRLGRSTVLHLPRSNFRNLHFEVSGSLSPNRFTGLSVQRLSASEVRYVGLDIPVQWQQKGKDSVATFTVPARMPVNRIAFDAPAQPANFSRDVSIEVSEEQRRGNATDSQPPIILQSSGSLLRIHRVQQGQRVDEERLFLEPAALYADGATRWTLTIHNGDDAPVSFSAVHLLMQERDLCFEALPSGRYALFYGDSALASPSYDYARWFTPQSLPQHVQLGAEQTNLGYQLRPDGRAFTERHPALLWIALVAVILLLGAIALRSARPSAPLP